MENILEIRNVSKQFGSNVVLDGISMTVRSGEILALCGENGAGKSTLMNIISGILKRDGGEIIFNGKSVNFKSVRKAVASGIAFVHQELSLCQHLTVAENMWMWNIPRHAGIIDHEEMYRRTDAILSSFHASFDARSRVGSLSVAQQQIAEIAKALSLKARLIILDEPTSAITDEEAENLFKVCKRLKEQGIGIIYISHRMNEVFSLCDRVTVLRDGHMILTENIVDIDENKVITSMVGREISDLYPPKAAKESNEELLRVEHFTGKRFRDVSFSLKKGKILGVAGLIGAGRSELMQAMVGLGGYRSGRLFVKGSEVRFHRYAQAIEAGICYLTEDRKKNGLFLEMPIGRNVVAAILDRIAAFSLLSQSAEDAAALKYKEEFGIKTSDIQQNVKALSGGNQQKVLIAKWIAANPEILIVDEPTRGVDVGAKSEIYQMLRKLSDNGVGIILISSEMPEVIGMSDEVIVMHEGRLVGTVDGERITETNLMLLASNKSIDSKTGDMK